MGESDSPRPARAWSPAAPAGPWDAVVIGAGVGGLAVANLLSRVGQRVLVLEQHRVPGGYSQSFRRAGWSWDVGLHVVGEASRGTISGRLLRALAGDALRWTRVDEPYDAVELPGGKVVPIPAGLGPYRESLERAFPSERTAIRTYLEKLRSAALGMRDYMIARTPGRPRSHAADAARSSAGRSLALMRTAEVVGGLTDHPGLRAVLLVPWGFYGSPPARSAFGMHALMVRHFRSGAFYPVGGSMSIARALTTELARARGWVRVSAPVERVLVRRGRAAGARLATGEEILAPVVVGAAGALNSLDLLPEHERAEPWVEAVRRLPPACAHVCLYVGFRGDIQAAGASRTNRWLCADADPTPWDLGERAPSIYVSFPSLKDPLARGAEGLHTAELVCLVSWDSFARWTGTPWRARGELYDDLKKRISERLLARLLARMPGLEPLVAYTELSTPVSAEHFVRASRGSAYGLEATPERFSSPWLRPRTPLPGLFLAGSDVAVSGITGALFGGVAAASAIAPQVVDWIRGAVRSQWPRRSATSDDGFRVSAQFSG